MGKTGEEEFITAVYHNVINEKPGHISYNGVRHYLSKKEIQKLKPTFTSLETLLENVRHKIHVVKQDRKEGGLLPLLALLPLIFGGVAAAGAVTGGVATAVAKSKENQEQVRHNAEMERIAKEKAAKGSGFCEDNDSENDEIEEIKYCINTLKGAGFLFI
jgi:hypothetical protein